MFKITRDKKKIKAYYEIKKYSLNINYLDISHII